VTVLRLTLTLLTHLVIAGSIFLSALAYWSGDRTLLQYSVAYMGALVAAFASIGVWIGLRGGLVVAPGLLALLVGGAIALGLLPLAFGYGTQVDIIGQAFTRWLVVAQVLVGLWQIASSRHGRGRIASPAR
jgi:hypothetical protein